MKEKDLKEELKKAITTITNTMVDTIGLLIEKILDKKRSRKPKMDK